MKFCHVILQLVSALPCRVLLLGCSICLSSGGEPVNYDSSNGRVGEVPQGARSALPEKLTVRPWVAVDLSGLKVGDLLLGPVDAELGDKVMDTAPALLKTNVYTRSIILQKLGKIWGDKPLPECECPEQLYVSRKKRPMDLDEVQSMLQALLQRDYVRESGELELTLSREWNILMVPVDHLRVRMIEMPVTGLNPNFVARFELSTAREVVGSWTVALQARIWKEMLLTTTPVRRGQSLRDVELRKERRDLMMFREPLPVELPDLAEYEFKESLTPNQVLFAKSVRMRPVILRGKLVDASIRTGFLSVSLKVEALEDGTIGQLIRVRNPQTRKEFFGKVEQGPLVYVPL